MESRRKKGSCSFGQLSYRPGNDEGLLPKTLEFVKENLQPWLQDKKRPSSKSEKGMNSSLCDFLDVRARENLPMVRFKHESPQTDARTVDLGVHSTKDETFINARSYSIYEPFLVIEGKRLPSPTKAREREYVTGSKGRKGSPSGGIQRFKLGLHGAKVDTAIIIGYVEKNSYSYWFEEINKWIKDLSGNNFCDSDIWNERDGLTQFIDACVATSVSNHPRVNTELKNTIKLYHIWVSMNS